MSLKSLISTQSLRLKRVNVSNATYYSPYGINATMLIVSGGGGAGGWSINTYNGGGGGGGGLVYNSNIPIYNLYNYTVVVGAGGAGGSTAGANGSNSSIIGGGYLGSLSFTTALGGGGGGGGTFTSSGYNGGSGGGGGGIVSATAGGTSLQNSIIGYGFGNLGAGGIGNYSSGGGGGAGASGSLYNAGNGLAYNFANGSSVYYAGGGAGVNGSGNTAGTAGLGGGGVSTALSTSLNGANNTGGGGGGSNNTVSGGSGGSGIVIVSYPLPQYFTGGIVTNLTSNVVHTFNTSASLNGLLTPIDTYQPYNSLILHAEGTNGSNNSVFLDSSSGGVKITKTGNPGQGTFTPFLNSGWSNYFGSGNYLSIGAGTNTAMPGDFTMEGWIYGSANTIMGQGAATSAFSLGVTTTGYPFVSVDIQYGEVAEGQTLSLTAPTGMVFTSLLYAGYGEINGTAPNYGNNRVSGTSRSICETTFIGKSGTVSQAATNAIFGDPAGGTAKYLAVTATVGLMSTSVIDLTKWNHIAAVRSGSILTLYVNGVPVSSITYASTVGAASANVYVGTNYENTASILTTLGNLSNVRIVRGNALYTSGFTVPTTQLTAVANTILLTCSNTIIKASNSINSNVAVGVTGSLQVQSFAPFNPSNTYSTTLVGGSLYFNGSTDFLTIANNSNQEFGANNFTIEFFWYPQSTSRQWFYHATTDYWFGVDYASQGAVMGLWASSTGSSWNLINADAGGNGISTGAPKINQWNHVAVGRNGGTWSMWLNGARCLNLTGITSAIVDRSTQNKIVGAWAGGTQYFVNGYLSNFKIVNGTDIYGVTNSNITVPTSPLTATANTVLLLNGTNAGIIDNSSQKVNLTAYGTGVVSNTISKFGNTSLYFDGTSGYFGVTGSPSLFNFGTGDYTVEMWIYLTATANYQYLFDTNTNGDGSTATPFRLRVVPITGGYGLDMVNQGGSTISGLLSSTSYPMQLNTWNHVAVVTQNGVTSFYHNGNLSNTPTTTGLSWYCTATNRPVIGISGSPASQNWFQGYMDDIRVTKGYARYSVNFTPPTSAFLDT